MDYHHILTSLLLFSIVVASIHFIISNFMSKNSKSSKYPPGPYPFPIIGNILEIGSHPHQAFAKLSKTYGPVMSLKLGRVTTIVVSSPQAAREILQKNDRLFSFRAIPDTIRALDHNILSLMWLPPSTQWRVLRRACATKVFSSKQLDATQTLRKRKVQELLDYVDERCRKGEAVDIGDTTFTTMLNSMSNTFFSMDLARYSSDKSGEFKDMVWGITEETGRPNVVDFFPILRGLDPQRARARMNSYFEKLVKFLDGLIEERLQLGASDMEYKGCNNDVLDSLIQLMIEEDSQISRSHLSRLFLDLFVAGIDTTSSTVEWAMTELLHNPEKLEKAREELTQVLGKGEQLDESHISKLPFLRAVVKETMRLHPPAPLLLPRKTEADVELCGFMVPKNARVLVNVWAMGRDSSVWDNPYRFMPERFLESDVDFKGHHFELIPFGGGRRICAGLPLADRTLHVMLASLLHLYDWKLADGLKAEGMDMSENFGITLHKSIPLQAIPIKL